MNTSGIYGEPVKLGSFSASRSLKGKAPLKEVVSKCAFVTKVHYSIRNMIRAFASTPITSFDR